MLILAGALLGLAAASAHAQSLPWAKRQWGYITTPDGTRLRYSVLLPAEAGRFPVLINYSGYDAGEIGGSAYQQGNTWMETALDARLLKAGFAVMGLQMRGTGCSSGRFDLFGPKWGPDGAAGVEWAAQQPWSTGHVGMYLWSWPGLSQLFVAAQRPPHLDAIAPGMVVTDPLRDVGAPGGIANPQFPYLWWGTIMDAWTYAGQDAAGDGDTTCAANLARNYAEGQAFSPPADSGHLFEDGFWAKRDLRSQTARIDVPVLSVADWQDEEVGSRGGYYQDLLDPSKTWYVGTNGQHDIYVSNHLDDTLLAFFEHFLAGADNHFEQTPHAQLWMDTSSPGGPQSSDADLEQSTPGFVVSQPSLPLRVRPLALHLTRTGGLTARAQPPDGGSVSYVPAPGPIVNDDIPGAVTGSGGGSAGEAPWQDSRPAPRGSLAFTTTPMSSPLTVAGSASLDLWLSSTAPDTDLQVTVTEVRPDGQELYLQRGWLRASERAIDRALSTPLRPVHKQTLSSVRPLIPGKAVLARVEIPMFAHTFRPGSALRIWLDAPSPTGDWGFISETANAIDTIWTNAARPSTLKLGVIDGGTQPEAYPPCGSLVGEPCRPNPLPVSH